MQEQRADPTLTANEERFRTLADNISQLAWMADSNGWIFWYNRRWYEFTGTTLDEMQGWGWTKVHHPEHVDRVVERIKGSWQTGEPWEDTFPLRGRDGEFRWFLSRALPIRDEHGSVVCWFGTNTDITAQLEYEQERERLLASERSARHRVEGILETAIDGIITIDDEGRIHDFNPAAERMFGYARTDVAGHDLTEVIVPPRFRDAHRRGFARFLATGEGRVLNTRTDLMAVRADGTEFPVEIAVTRIADSDPPLCAGYIRDVTEIHRNEQGRALRYAVTSALANAASIQEASSEILREVCETLGWQVGELWLVDHEAGLLRHLDAWNVTRPSIEEFTAMSRTLAFPEGAGLLGSVWATGEAAWLPDLAVASNFTRPEIAMKAGLHAVLAIPIRLGGEVLGVMQFIASSIENPDGPLLQSLAIAGNQIGQFIGRKLAEEERAALLVREQSALADAEAALRTRDQVLSTVTHDLRTPLAAISLYAQVLRDRAGIEAPEVQSFLEEQARKIGQAAKDGLVMIEELLDAARLTMGEQLLLELAPVDLVELVGEAVIRHHESASQHALLFEVPHESVIGSWDPPRLRRVIDNLLSNATKYSPPGSSVYISLAQEDDASGQWAVTRVTDEGSGIPSEDLPHVFEWFWRGKNVTGRRGSGLGLAGARRIAELHGGTIEVDSQIGRGSTFTVRLPL